MANRYKYVFKTFASGKRKGQSYVNVVSVKTGKTIRTVSSKTELQKAQKGVYQQKRRGKASKEKLDVIERLDREGNGGTFTEYAKEYKKVYKIIEQKNAKGKYKRRLTKGQMRGMAKKTTIQHKTGTACRYRYAWRYFLRIGTDDEGQPICDTSPVFMAGKLHRAGSEDYKVMVDICMDIWKPIKLGIESGDICSSGAHKVQGGHCVILYHKSGNKTHIKQHERGVGCAASIDFKKMD